MPENPRTPTTLLVVILLAVLVEPFLLAMVMGGGGDPGAVRSDPRLARAIEALTASLDERRGERQQPAEADAASAETLAKIAVALERLAAGRLPDAAAIPRTTDPTGAAPSVNDLPEEFADLASPRERVDAVIRQELDRRSNKMPVLTTRFFLKSLDSVLAEFGRPTSTYIGNGWFRVFYKGESRQFYLDLMDGRVVRFGF